MANKHVFNTDFTFEDYGNVAPLKPRVVKKQIVENDVDEDQNMDDFNEDLKRENKKLREIGNKKDLVRIKESSAKKRKVIEEEFFEKQAEVKKTSDFDQMNISKPLMKAINLLGFQTPTPIQQAVVPTALLGKDMVACAVTGSGKTLAFMLPTLERLLYKPKYPQVTRVLVLTPTRELAAQICQVTRDLAQYTNVQAVLCAGGFDIKTQEASLRLGPDIVIATPGRLIDHLHNTPCFSLDTVEILILDEADRMLDEYFAEQIKEVIKLCSKTRQTMLFSATMTDKVEDLVSLSLVKPVKIFINENVDVNVQVKQEFIRIRDDSERTKDAVLSALITRKFNDRVIVFVKTKLDCHRLCLLLNLVDINAAELHGGLTQTQRLDKLNQFKEDHVSVLVATDLAARGLDISNVKTVINYAMPMTFKHYIHRVGRTARGGNSGRAISMVTEKDRWLVKEIMKSSVVPVKSRVIPSEVIKAFREKIDSMSIKLKSTLKKENEEKLMEEADIDLKRAERKMNNKKNEGTKMRRTWLDNVDYKTGSLKSDLMKKKQQDLKVKREQRKAKRQRTNDDED